MLAARAGCAAGSPPVVDISADEDVVFFRTCAHLDEDGKTWNVPLHGMIYDVDDTIKHSQVADHKAVLANTFLHRFKPVPGMPELYRECAQKGVVFHYVSGSPWQLYLPLADFLVAEGLPLGSGTLRSVGRRDRKACTSRWPPHH